MKLLLKILFFVLATFQINIGDAKVFLLDKAISEVAHSNTFNSEEDSVQYENVFLENDFANTCKSERDLLDYRNLAISCETTAAKGVTQVEQYALRAAEDGFYPVMKRGFANPQELSWLNKGDVWKFGTTKNPLTRYSQSYLDNIGEFGVYYKTEFTGSLKQALTVERMKILNFRGQNGFLPAGNKILK